eukprot:7210902-Ditylum_brightwellii.AAC.1
MKVMKISEINITIKWIEAHQDLKHPKRTMSLPAKLNCKVDADAATYMNNYHTPSTTPSVFLSTKAILNHGDVV